VALSQPGKYLPQMPSQVVFPVLDRLEPATGALALGKAFNQTAFAEVFLVHALCLYLLQGSSTSP